MPDANEFIGPKPPSPFDNITEQERLQLDQALSVADGIKQYYAAGRVGAGANWKPYVLQLEKRGGLSPEEALTLGRYRMWKQGIPVPNEVKPPPTPEQIKATQQLLLSPDVDRKTKAGIIHQGMQDDINAQQGFYNSLVRKPEPQEQPAYQSETYQKLAKPNQGEK